MKIKYFPDTDTALIDFRDNEITETKELSETVYVDFDATGNLVSMTIEHAKESGRCRSCRIGNVDLPQHSSPLSRRVDPRG